MLISESAYADWQLSFAAVDALPYGRVKMAWHGGLMPKFSPDVAALKAAVLSFHMRFAAKL